MARCRGGLHVATAETVPQGTVELAVLSGYGYRKGLLAPGHTINRASGDIAVAYAALPYLTVGLSLDGRYDKHSGLPMIAASDKPTDDGYVGDPHVLARVGRAGRRRPARRPARRVGAWQGRAVDRRLGDLGRCPGAALARPRVRPAVRSTRGSGSDNSAKSADDVDMLSLGDRVSLGVSSFSAGDRRGLAAGAGRQPCLRRARGLGRRLCR